VPSFTAEAQQFQLPTQNHVDPSPQHGTSSGYGWRIQPPDMECSPKYKYTE